MSRLYFMTFLGRRRWVDEAHPHESPSLMTIPMIVLAVGSAALGGLLAFRGAFQTWLEPSTGAGHEAEPVLAPIVVTVLTLVVVAAGLALAFRMYLASRVVEVQPRGSIAPVAARRDLFQDDVNEAVFMRPGQYLTRFLVFADLRGVDGAVRGAAASIGGLAGRARRWQTGFVRSYAMSMLAGVLVLALGVLVVQI
jgi:NADH-quinone oxidoreductase subunit L